MIVAKWHNFFIYSALKEAITSRYHLDPKYITNIQVRFFFFFFFLKQMGFNRELVGLFDLGVIFDSG